MSEWLTIDGISYIPSTVLLTGIQKISLKDNQLFAVLDTKGECPYVYQSELGFYFSDTRYLGNWEMTINGQQLAYLSHELRGQGNSCIFAMTNRDIPSLDQKSRIQRDSLLIRRILTFVQDTIYEHLEITNYDVIGHEIEVQQFASSKFDDIFEVRGMKRAVRGEILSSALDSSGQSPCVVLGYRGQDDILRKTFIKSMTENPEFLFQPGAATISYRTTVPPKGRCDIKTIISFNRPGEEAICGENFRYLTPSEHLSIVEDSSNKVYLGDVSFSSDNPIFDRCIRNARLDIEMLITEDVNSTKFYPYAGVPWFSAPFGRDGLITAYQCLPWYPKIAIGVLDYVFEHIGKKFDSFTDEEPGKIFHETRRGEMANLREIPYIPYYGSVDSTPLTLILLGEYFAWTHDYENLKKWWPSALLALDWINTFGDFDNDGFVEYKKRSSSGLDNQGWKDSHDSIMHANGSLATPPIELCEVQAYVYRAKKHMAILARHLKDETRYQVLNRQADNIQNNFRNFFWDKNDGYIYLARDQNGDPCKVMSSNQGHCLWGQILNSSEAASVANHLMSPRLFSGYGIRTLASDENAYNPLSYHNGSIWPHDNSLIAEGFRYYRQIEHLQRLGDALFDVVATSFDFRLPELYCGFRRRSIEPPIPYEVACKPQAWAGGSIFLILKSMLGLMMQSDQENIVFQSPILPSKVASLEIRNINVRGSTFDVNIYRGKNTCNLEVTKRAGPIQIMIVK